MAEVINKRKVSRRKREDESKDVPAKAKKKKPATTESREIFFKKKKVTPGAVQYDEVDADGNKVDIADASFMSCYLRKSFLKECEQDAPETFSVTVHF